MVKAIHNLKTKFKKEIETLKRIQIEMKMELKSSVTHYENSGEGFTGRPDQGEDGISGTEDKAEDLSHTS